MPAPIQPTSPAAPRLNEDREVAVPTGESYRGASSDPLAVAHGATMITGSPGIGLALGALSLLAGDRAPGLTQQGAERVAQRFGGPLKPLRLGLGVGGVSLRNGASSTNAGEIGASVSCLPFKPPLTAERDNTHGLMLSGWRHVMRPYLDVDAAVRLTDAGIIGHRVEGRVLSLIGATGSSHDIHGALDSAGRQVLAVGDAHLRFDVRAGTLGFASEHNMDGLGSQRHGVTLSLADLDGQFRVGSLPLSLTLGASLGRGTIGAAQLGSSAIAADATSFRPVAGRLGIGAHVAGIDGGLTGHGSLEYTGDTQGDEPFTQQTLIGARLAASKPTKNATWTLNAGIDRYKVTTSQFSERDASPKTLGEASSVVYSAGAKIEF